MLIVVLIFFFSVVTSPFQLFTCKLCLTFSRLRMRYYPWNRFPIKTLLIDSLLTLIVESTYFKVKCCDHFTKVYILVFSDRILFKISFFEKAFSHAVTPLQTCPCHVSYHHLMHVTASSAVCFLLLTQCSLIGI